MALKDKNFIIEAVDTVESQKLGLIETQDYLNENAVLSDVRLK